MSPNALLCSLKQNHSNNFLLQFEVLEKSALRNGRKCFKTLLDREDNSIQHCLQLRQMERNILLVNSSRNCVFLVSMVRLGSRVMDWSKEQVIQEMEVKPGTCTHEKTQESNENENYVETLKE